MYLYALKLKKRVNAKSLQIYERNRINQQKMRTTLGKCANACKFINRWQFAIRIGRVRHTYLFNVDIVYIFTVKIVYFSKDK